MFRKIMLNALGSQLGNVVFLENELSSYEYKFKTCPIEALLTSYFLKLTYSLSLIS
jgi:hypothetical protein